MEQIKHYKALAFDFDGTLFDTKELNYKAYKLAYWDLGVEINREMFAKTNGLGVYAFNDAMGVKCDVEELRELKQRYYKDMVLYAKPNEYLLNLIRECKLPKMLVTTARRSNILPLLESYDLERHFCKIVTQEDVGTVCKPSPLAYELALNSLENIKVNEVLAFEDSRPGFVSARRAGLDCVMVCEFQSDCIRDMSGGSGVKTQLKWNERENGLEVVKTAVDDYTRVRLENQREFIIHNPSLSVTVLSHDDWSYSMPYVIGTSVYEYQNRIAVLPKVIETVYNKSKISNVLKRDIRCDMFELYINPGIEVYEKITGKNVYEDCGFGIVTHNDIPDFVNCYREGVCHGDTTLENILVKRDGEIVLIDPVPETTVHGVVHDFSKILQSLYGYEFRRDNGFIDDEEYVVERKIFNEQAKKYLSIAEFDMLKFLTSCLYFRRLRHQIKQNPELVRPYGDVAIRLMNEFLNGDYTIR